MERHFIRNSAASFASNLSMGNERVKIMGTSIGMFLLLPGCAAPAPAPSMSQTPANEVASDPLVMEHVPHLPPQPKENCDEQMHVWAKRFDLPAPINLARTTLAAVNASTVNGGRAMDDPFYGVLNAFDDGRNWKNNINYTTWLTSNEPVPWIDISFDEPVTLAGVFVESGPRFSTQAFIATGGEYDFRSCRDLVLADEPVPDVTRVRVNFHREGPDDWRPLSVAEVRVFGYPDANSIWEPGPPRVESSDP